ncbi:MAG: tetratricopeptide repeat protein [candidate division WOR-3 bacterium]|nr:tetratricopeptide repeat protein [candidate division WOR-3 bacterium]
MISPEEYKVLKSFAERIPDNDPGAHNNLAVVYYNKGLYEEAIQELEKALSIDPNFTLARNNLEIILRKSGKLESKVKELAHHIDVEPFDERKTLELADTYRKLNRYSQAIIYYRKVLDFNPGSYEAHFGLGITLKNLGKYDDALEEIKKSLEIKISPEGYRLLGEIYFNKGIIDLAIKNFQEAIMLDPSSAEAHFFLGFALGEKGLHKEGREEIKKAIQLNPALAQFEPNLPIELKEHKGYLEFLKEQLGVPRSSVNEYQVHFNLGVTYRNKGLFTEAKREFEEALKLKSDDADLYAGLGEVNLFLNKLDEAHNNFSKCLELDAFSVRGLNGLGIVFLKKNNFQQAKIYFEKSLAIDNKYVQARANLGLTLYLLNQIEEGVNVLREAMEQGSEEARYNLGMYLYKKGDYEQVLRLFKDESVDGNFFKGLVYAELGRDEEALAAFRSVINTVPGYAGAFYNLGFLLMKTGQFEEGLSNIRRGMEIEPNYEKEKYRIAIAPELYEYGLYYTPAKIEEKFEEKIVEEVEEFFPTLEVPTPQDYIQEAENFLKRNEFDKALNMVDEALKLVPEMSEAVVLKSRILFQSGNIDDALNNLEVYTQRHPDDIDSILSLAGMLKSLGRLKEAKAKYQSLLRIQGDNLDYLREVASLSLALNELDDAFIIYKQLFEKNPSDISVNLGLLHILLKKKDLISAEKHAGLLEKERPETYDFYAAIGLYYLEKNERTKAKNYFEKAIELEPAKPFPYYHLGIIAVQEGKFEEACSYWKKAMLLSPDEELAGKITHCLNITMEMMEFLKSQI